jgi:hypothetical protein
VPVKARRPWSVAEDALATLGAMSPEEAGLAPFTTSLIVVRQNTVQLLTASGLCVLHVTSLTHPGGRE